jgi:hypothetical protein
MPHFLRSFRGLSEARQPGIHTPQRLVMDSGLASTPAMRPATTAGSEKPAFPVWWKVFTAPERSENPMQTYDLKIEILAERAKAGRKPPKK